MGLLLSAEHPECDGLVPCDSGSGDGGVKDTGGGTDRAYREIVKMFWDHLAVRGWPGPCSVSSRYTPGRRSVARISSCAAQDRMGLLFQPSLRIRRDPPDPVDLMVDQVPRAFADRHPGSRTGHPGRSGRSALPCRAISAFSGCAPPRICLQNGRSSRTMNA